MSKKLLGLDVLTAAKQRISKVFDDFSRIYVAFSAGKDSSVLLHLTMEEARKRNKRVGVLLVDLEAQYQATIKHGIEMFEQYKNLIDPYWISLPISLRNAVSAFDPKWVCWGEADRSRWVRMPPELAITDKTHFPFFRYGMEFEEFVDDFGHWYGNGEKTACLIGIRADESINRYRTLVANKTKHENLVWTTFVNNNFYKAYPIYDWKTRDIWIFNGKFQQPYNKLYDLMAKAGVPLSQQRICQPYGDDQRRGLWLFHVIEPETWSRVVARVNGANSGSLYAKESGNVLGRIKIVKPDNHSWQSFASLLLESMPPKSKEHFINKITVFLKWYKERGYPDGIPDDGGVEDGEKRKPSWKRICKALLRNDYWCKGLSFSQTKSDSYENYNQLMKRRRLEWGISW